QYVSSGLNSPVLAAQQSVDLLLKAISGELPKSDWGKTVFTQAVGVDCSNIEDYYDPQSIF
ncbi:MAG: sugar ABC transporter substrate-binding protein, partial [Chloroflexi bacterium]|nr:sugar ABC transporter substrate-binding protein [Chloroflexota bacterium]